MLILPTNLMIEIFFSDECGTRFTQENIIGGELAQPGEFPYMALLGYKLSGDKIFYLCGGTLINRFYVVTAAHCHNDEQSI